MRITKRNVFGLPIELAGLEIFLDEPIKYTQRPFRKWLALGSDEVDSRI
jgi:hypothetical protein